ncbi:oxygen-independent coproporphyrinogen III oxidase [Denitrificimonas sp. JX-1]|uniref:Coproporphyrinogen-III oxidase n=1 Tax=Denitrificimonas halotolerans TaxID=3098930 RepID=A0ABU5GWT9_9GAMM|nr:oxygen-independent coproporphyrinogen III oxidase [Denitrificimonas sp. JX-1]MDY7220108.1 oxygen-independent coproporphyrinogen III oxidase [Denitrificimonas sp. JX-1]
MKDNTAWSSKLFSEYHRLEKQYNLYPAPTLFQHSISNFERFRVLRDQRKTLKPLAINVNIPFCSNACYYCSSNSTVTKDRSLGASYIHCLEQEIRLVARHLNSSQPVKQLHFGGGTPTFLKPNELKRLMDCLKNHFNIHSNHFTQYTIDIDPREADWSTMGVLRDIGFNQVNIEVQGLDPDVQHAINRLQSIEQTQTIVDAARTLQFRNISISLTYGLPKQTFASFSKAISQVIQLSPERVILHGYKHQPNRYPRQKHIKANELPSPRCIEYMLNHALQQFTRAGYQYIGMGLFALTHDELTSAQEDGSLHYGLNGYTTSPNCNTLGFGVSAISQFGSLYYQNTHDLFDYQAACSQQQLSPAKSLCFNIIDQVKRYITQALACQFSVNFTCIEQFYQVNCKTLFQAQWPQLEQMHADGLLTLSEHNLTITEQGRLFTAAVCQLFNDSIEQDTTLKAATF